MKILQIAPKIPYPPTDGGKLSIWGVTKYLSKSGHKIDFVCYRKNDDVASVIDKLNEFVTPFILDVQTDNNFLGAIKNCFSRVPYNVSKYYSRVLKEFLRDYFEINNPDIIHVTNLHMGWVVDEVRKYTKAPVLLRQENVEMFIMKRYSENQSNPILKIFSAWQYRKFIKYEPEICKKFDLCVMITENDEKNLLSFDESINTCTIPVGVEKQLLEINKDYSKSTFTLAHIGHLDWLPNYDSVMWFMRDIFPIVIDSFPKARLHIFGGGEPSGFRIPEKVKNNVVIEGFVDDLWKELLNKSLAVVPLRIGSGIRVKILEMLAVGQNILSTSIGKEGIDVENESEILIADTVEDFADYIIRFFNNEFNSEQIVKAGQDKIQSNYTWEIISTKFEHEYNEWIENNQ